MYNPPGDSRAAVVLLGTTEGGKEINLIRKPGASMRVIAFGSGGELPSMLEGGFSSVSAASQIVSSYLAKVKSKEINIDGSKVVKKVVGKPAKKAVVKK